MTIKTGITTFFLLMTVSLSAQLGVRLGYADVSQSKWTDLMFMLDSPQDISFNNMRLSIDYRKRIKAARIELYPTLNIIKAGERQMILSESDDEYGISYDNITASLNTHVYIFDLEGECDCPTWGKEGGFFKKGFFLFAAPEIGTRLLTLSAVNGQESERKASFLWGISGGAGLDIGLAEKFTITPIFRTGYYGGTSLPDVVGAVSSSTFYYGAEIRLGIEL